MHVVVYSKPNCPYCVRAKSLLSAENISYHELVIGQDIIREEFLELYPEARTVPQIIVDGTRVGGYEELVEWVSNRPSLLNE